MGAVPDKYVFIKESNNNVTLQGYLGATLIEQYSINPAKDIRISQSYPDSIVIPVDSIGNHVDNKFVCIPWERIAFAQNVPPSAPTNIMDAVMQLGEYFFFESGIAGAQGPAGPTGAQGPIGPQGVPGPVGPAGLNWQGAWSASGTYVVDDAVGYNGASWFCIAPVGPSATPPDTDTTNWALLAAQGATGPQGPQGIQGPAGSSTQTAGAVPSTVSTTNPANVLIYDRNSVSGATNQNVRLPDNAPIGKEVLVQYTAFQNTDFVRVYCFNLGIAISVNNAQSSQDFYTLYAGETVRFISRGSNSWISEYVIGTNITFNNTRIPSFSNNINETIVNTTTSALTAANLNAAYPPVQFGVPTPIGFKVYCPNIVGGGLVYIKTGFNTWVSSSITVVT